MLNLPDTETSALPGPQVPGTPAPSPDLNKLSSKEVTRLLTDQLGDKLWRLNNLYHIVNERAEDLTFNLNDVQSDLDQKLWYQNIILKSRQHGITTYFCIDILDECLFNSNLRGGIIAHTESVARDIFIDKVKYAYDHLPDWLLKRVTARRDSARELSFSNGSAIRVDTSMRGKTLQYLHISEFGKICKKYPEKAREIVTGSINAVHAGQFLSIESTAEGKEGYFYDFCMSAEKMMERRETLTPLDMKFFFYPWYLDVRNSLDPTDQVIPEVLERYFDILLEKHGIILSDNQKVWYWKKWAIQGEDEMKREHPSTPGEAFAATLQGIYFASEFKRIYKEKRIGKVPWVDGMPVDTWWDLGMNDTNVIWFVQPVGRELRFIDYYENSGEGLAHYVDVLRGKPYRYGSHVAPHDIKVRELGTGVSRFERAAELGLNFEVAEKLDKQDQIDAARKYLPYAWFDEKRCDLGIKALEQYRKEWDDRNGCYKMRPLHNWASNASDAFQTGCVGYDPFDSQIDPAVMADIKRGRVRTPGGFMAR